MHRVCLGLLAGGDGPVGHLDLLFVEQPVVDGGLDVGVDRCRYLVQGVRDHAQLVAPLGDCGRL